MANRIRTQPYFILFSLRSTLLIIDLREFGSYSPPSFLRTVNTKFASNGSSSVGSILCSSQGQETATDTRVTTPQDEIDVIASVSEPNHENISENMDVVQNVNHEQADTVQIPPEFDNEFFRMSESEIQE
jgi:hypothetical protein